jgi:hypothetical protein
MRLKQRSTTLLFGDLGVEGRWSPAAPREAAWRATGWISPCAPARQLRIIKIRNGGTADQRRTNYHR